MFNDCWSLLFACQKPIDINCYRMWMLSKVGLPHLAVKHSLTWACHSSAPACLVEENGAYPFVFAGSEKKEMLKFCPNFNPLHICEFRVNLPLKWNKTKSIHPAITNNLLIDPATSKPAVFQLPFLPSPNSSVWMWKSEKNKQSVLPNY